MGATLMAIRAVLGLDDSEYNKGLQNAERQGKKTAEELRKDVMKMAAEYRKGGMDASEAIKKAWAEIDRTQYETAEKSEGHAKKVENDWSESAENAGKSWGGFLGLFSRNLGEAEERSSVFAQVLKANIVTKGVEVCIKGLTSLGSKAKEVFSGAIDSFANYEQLAGGVETLFGSSAKKVLDDAEKAYKTAGMSANQYMETSIQSAAALINSLGGDQKKAADLMNLSITDMADNVNKMGTTMDGVQNAYRGFSRGNFTMLDNLALGFAGTKEGMQELLDKAQAISGVKYDISSYADIVQAIHVVQTEMGITGTTAKEAEGTISGSLSSLQAAWANMLASIGKGSKKEIAEDMGEVVKTAETYLRNILPVAKRILFTALPTLAKEVIGRIPALAGQLVAALPSLWQKVNRAIQKDFIPMIARTISNFVGGGDKFTKMLTSNFRKDFRDIVGIFRAVGEKLAEVWTGVIQPIAQGVVRLIAGTIMPNLFNLYRFHIAPLWEEISPKISATIQKISRLWTKTLYPTIQKVSRYILKDVAPKVVDFLSKNVLPAVSKVVNFVRQNLPIILSVVSGVIAGIMAYKIGQTITNTISIVQKVVGAAKALWAVLAANPIAVVIGAVVALVSYLVYLYNTNDDVRDKINAAWEAIKGYWENTLKPVFENLWKYVTETVVPAVVSAWNDTFLPAIESAWGAVKGFWENTLKPVFVALYDYVWRDLIPTLIVAWEYHLAPAIKGVFEGIGKWWSEIGAPALQAVGEKFGEIKDKYLFPVLNWIEESFITVWGAMKTRINGLLEFLMGAFSGDWERAWQGLVDAITAPFNALKDILKEPINAVIRLVNSMLEKVETAVNNVISAINNNLRISIPPLEWNDGWNIHRIGGFSWGANLSTIDWGKIPELAKGGTVREGGLAVVGENEPEWLQVINGRAVVTPMSGSNRRAVTQMPSQRTPINERPIEIVFELEGAQKWVYRLNKAEEQRVGLKLSTGGSY